MKQAYAATKTLQSVLVHHLTQPISRAFDEDGKERFEAMLRNLAELVQPVAADVERIMNDPKFTDQGKQDKLLATGPRVAGNFKNIGIVVSEAEKAKARLDQVIDSPLTDKPEGNEVVAEMRAHRILQDIGKRDAGPQFLAAIDRNDLETARALLSAPGQPWISDEIRKRGREAFALRTNPEAWRKLQYVEVLRESLSALASQVAAWLLLLGASPASVQAATGVTVPPSAKVMQMGEFLAKAQAK